MIKVLIVDDSALIRQMLSEILNQAGGIEVVGVAPDPFVAREKIKKLNPDVLNLMRLRPMPVVMFSSLTESGAGITLEALEIGAVDFVSKPKLDVDTGLTRCADEIIAKVRAAAGARVRPYAPRTARPVAEKLGTDAVLQPGKHKHLRTTERIIGIGSSTGGTEALMEVLEVLPPAMPGIVITQHIPKAFSGSFARRLNGSSALQVQEASDGQQILPGHAYLAPGDRHLLVERSGARYLCRLNDGPAVSRHKPSVNVMFRSLAQNVGPNALALMLTGMGDDGAESVGEMREQGARVLVQDEKTSVVWGMPGEVVRRGYADEILSLYDLGPRLAAWAADET